MGNVVNISVVATKLNNSTALGTGNEFIVENKARSLPRKCL